MTMRRTTTLIVMLGLMGSVLLLAGLVMDRPVSKKGAVRPRTVDALTQSRVVSTRHATLVVAKNTLGRESVPG